MRERIVTKSVALTLARWTGPIPAEYRARAEEILIAAARAGADLRALAAICAEIRARAAPADPDSGRDPDRGVCLETTFAGAGDLTPECAAMVQAVLDALSAPQGPGDPRTCPERYHDALEEAMRRLLAPGLWIADYRARWAARRAAASVSTGDGGAWLEADAARRVACDAMLIPSSPPTSTPVRSRT
jgi:Domain of unknown function (DUF222)